MAYRIGAGNRQNGAGGSIIAAMSEAEASGDDRQAAAADLLRSLERCGLIAPGDTPEMAPLTGGVSSDIWRVDLPAGPVCVKRALARLRVAQVWEAPVERNRYEWRWMQAAEAAVRGAVPQPLARDPEGHAFAMAFLDPARYPLWKAELRDGRADPAFAARVGTTLAAIHAHTAGRPDVAAAFPTDEIFYAIRLEPYLVATARVHDDLSARLRWLVRRTAETHKALVHGDVSPKNILVGPDGPVFLDAECAWYGDPAFDLAFCLNHLLLKCLWTPPATPAFLACFDALSEAYLSGVRWEPAAELEERAAALLPALFLARIDGKSPVEYIEREEEKALVRQTARPLVRTPPQRLASVRQSWAQALENHRRNSA